jgi:hypothetical protein
LQWSEKVEPILIQRELLLIRRRAISRLLLLLTHLKTRLALFDE